MMTNKQHLVMVAIKKVSNDIHRQTRMGGPDVIYVSQRVYDVISTMDGFVKDTLINNRYHIINKNTWVGVDIGAVVLGSKLKYSYQLANSPPSPTYTPVPIYGESSDNNITTWDIPQVNIELVDEIQPPATAYHTFSNEEWDENDIK
jgi:hypothetical protein